jgi:TonB family protein
MTKPFLTTVFSISICASLFAQSPKTAKPDSAAYYMRDPFNIAHGQADAQFLRLIVKADSGMFVIQDYYPDGALRLLAKAKTDAVNFEEKAQGFYTEFFRNGRKKLARQYNNGQLVNSDSAFYANGALLNLIDNNKDGIFLKACFDSLGKVLAENGNGTWINRNEYDEQETLTGPVVNGKEEGIWSQKYAGNTINPKIEYKNGLRLPGQNYKPVTQIFSPVDVQPGFGKNDSDFNMYLARTVRYPKYARENNITGRVIVTFIVEKDGSLSDLKVLQSPHESLSEEALRVMKLSPRWRPGMQRGRPVRVQFSVPVAFALASE